MLEVYVNKQATVIQKVFKGWYVRERVRPLQVWRAFTVISRRGIKELVMNKVRAVISGWRIRRIMRTKEIANIVTQIKDY